jgi:hypothetical protein
MVQLTRPKLLLKLFMRLAQENLGIFHVMAILGACSIRIFTIVIPQGGKLEQGTLPEG